MKRKRTKKKNHKQTHHYSFWGPGTKVRAIKGDFKGFEGEIAAHDPLSEKQFLVFFDEKTFDRFAPETLEEIAPTQEIINKTEEPPQELPNQEEGEDLVRLCYACGSTKDLITIVENNKEVLKCFECRQNDFEKIQEEMSPLDQEVPLDTLLRLANQPGGVTLTELSIERKSNVKGPFVKTIKSGIRKKLIKKAKWTRQNENVYVGLEEKEDDDSGEFDTLEEESSDIQFPDIAKIVSKNENLEELGDLFIALGKILKRQS